MLRELIKVFIPTFISYMTFMLMSIVDAIFVGNFFGSSAQGAISLITPLILLISCVIFSFNIGANTYFGHALGNEDKTDANKIYNHAVIYGTIVIIGIIGLVNVILVPYLNLFSDNQEIINYANQYGRIYLSSMFIMNANLLLGFFQRTIGNASVMAKQSIISLVMNIVLNSLFMIVFKTDIWGLAVASMLSMLIQFGYAAYSIISLKSAIFKVKLVKLDLNLLSKMFVNGLSDALFDVSIATMTIVSNVLLVHFLGDIGLTYMYIATQLNMIQVNVLFSLADASTPLIATSYGSGEIKRTKQIRNLTIKLAIGMSFVIYIGMYIFKPFLFAAYGVDPAIVADVQVDTSLYLSTIFFFSVNQVYTAYYTAVGESLKSLVIGLSRNLILPLFFTLVIASVAGDKGVWIGTACGELTALVIVSVYTFRVYDKRMEG